MTERTIPVRLTAKDLYWILEAFGNSTPGSLDMEPGERAAWNKIMLAAEKIGKPK